MISSPCLCSKKDNSLFKEYLIYKNETTFNSIEGTTIGKCENCGTLKTFPRNNKKFFNPQQSRGEFYDLSEDKFIELFQPILRIVKKYKRKSTVLDVGCSSGILLSLLRKEGFSVMGIEPNQSAFVKARSRLGKSVYHGLLEDFLRKNKSKFDCIIYNHVLEHIANPIKEIALAKKILNKKGVMIVGVPNTRNVIFHLRQKYWESLMPNEHIWHFNDRYLEKIFLKLGFNLLEKVFSDHQRADYPRLKKIYFNFLSTINKFLNTGEAVLLVLINRR